MVIIDIWLRIGTRVIVNRCIGIIIAGDLSLVVSQLYRNAVTRPQSHVAVTFSSSLGAHLLDCINRTRDKVRKGMNALYIPATYVVIRNHKFRYPSGQLNGDLSVDQADGDSPLPLAHGKNPCRHHLYQAAIQRTEAER